MKIFISWSGNFSKEVAEKLSAWFPSVIQSVDVFFSPDDIGKGENWNNVLSKELSDCNFGIVCLTPENVAAPWIHFEAGALAKALNSRLSSLMLDINASEVKGPLSRFQNTEFERADFFKLVQAINNATDKPLSPNALTKIFTIMWTELEREIQPIIQRYKTTPSSKSIHQNDHEAIQEILRIVRKASDITSPTIAPERTCFPEDPKPSPSQWFRNISISNLGQKPAVVLNVLHTLTTIPINELKATIVKQGEFSITVPHKFAKSLLDALDSSKATFSQSIFYSNEEVTP